MFRKTIASALVVSGVFFGFGLVLAPPPLMPAAILWLVAATMMAGAFLLWPRYRIDLPQSLFDERPKVPFYDGPIPQRFSRPH